MLPLVDKPIIQYGVEEALHSGIRNIIIVTGRGKTAIEDHFDVSFELEHLLESRGKKDLLSIVRQVSDLIDVSYIRQKEALGLGHAVLRAADLVGPGTVRGGAGRRRDRRRDALPSGSCSTSTNSSARPSWR
jgi:UTP--glucose-1-phosphate uridylyltransferase